MQGSHWETWKGKESNKLWEKLFLPLEKEIMADRSIYFVMLYFLSFSIPYLAFGTERLLASGTFRACL